MFHAAMLSSFALRSVLSAWMSVWMVDHDWISQWIWSKVKDPSLSFCLDSGMHKQDASQDAHFFSPRCRPLPVYYPHVSLSRDCGRPTVCDSPHHSGGSLECKFQDEWGRPLTPWQERPHLRISSVNGCSHYFLPVLACIRPAGLLPRAHFGRSISWTFLLQLTPTTTFYTPTWGPRQISFI